MAERNGRLGRIALAALRLAFAAALVAAVGALAHLPLGEAPLDGVVRVALRTLRAKVVLCTERSAAELAALPAHMRQARDCRETAIDYRLSVAVDGVARVDRVVAHRGVRRNRPLIVDEQVHLPPGARTVEIEFAPVVPDGFAGDVSELPLYRLGGRVEVAPGRIAVATLSDGVLVWAPPLEAPQRTR